MSARDVETDLDVLAERFGFPKPVSEAFTPRPQVSAQIDLSEPALPYQRTTCCCALHGTLHDRRTCCPEHRQVRAGIPVPRMTPIDQTDTMTQENA